MELDYLRYDVFTDTPFAGNPLAVLIDPPELTDEQHRRIAVEFNLSETVFLRRRDDGAWDARIFTPAVELPFAGHPTIGAALALIDAGAVDAGAGTGSVLLHEGVGPVPVTIEGGVATLTTARAPHPVEVADPGDVAAALGLTIEDLHRDLGPRAWSAGVPFTIAAVRDVDTLGRIRIDTAAWEHGVALTDARELFVVAPTAGVRGEQWRARMFAPAFGIAEDPATGSAAAAACGFLAAHAGASRLADGWTIHQGVEMGRPSTLLVRAVLQGGELVAATVGGGAVRIGAGSMVVPPT